MRFSLATVATAALIFSASAAPHRGIGKGRNSTDTEESGKGRGRYPDGTFPSGLTAAPTAFPTGVPDPSTVSFQFPSPPARRFVGIARADSDDSDSSSSDSKDESSDSSDSSNSSEEEESSSDKDAAEEDDSSSGESSSDDKETSGSGDEEETSGSGDEESTSGSGDEESTSGSGDEESTSGSGDEESTSGDEESTSGSGDEESTSGSGDEESTSGSGDEESTSGSGDEESTSGSGDEESTGSGDESSQSDDSSDSTSPSTPPSSGSSNSSTPSTGGTASGTFPTAAGESTLSEVMDVTDFDGGMVRFGRGVACSGGEGGGKDAVFNVADGGSLSNVIIGADQKEGVHCAGACTITNVYWEAVCEDALTFKGDGDGTVSGGGAKGAKDKVVQHNGVGTITITGFYVENFGKLYRSCGNCEAQGERHVKIDGVTASGGSADLVGINSNFGDTATITNSCVTETETICQEYEGTSPGNEPKKLTAGPSQSCIYQDADVNAC